MSATHQEIIDDFIKLTEDILEEMGKLQQEYNQATKRETKKTNAYIILQEGISEIVGELLVDKYKFLLPKWWNTNMAAKLTTIQRKSLDEWKVE